MFRSTCSIACGCPARPWSTPFREDISAEDVGPLGSGPLRSRSRSINDLPFLESPTAPTQASPGLKSSRPSNGATRRPRRLTKNQRSDLVVNQQHPLFPSLAVHDHADQRRLVIRIARSFWRSEIGRKNCDGDGAFDCCCVTEVREEAGNTRMDCLSRCSQSWCECA